ALSSSLILLLLMSDQLEIWHLYALSAVASAFSAFQFPAFSAAMTLMLPKEQYGRANGMLATANSASGIAAPIFGGFLLTLFDLNFILVFDIITAAVAVGCVALAIIPQPKVSEAGAAASGSLWEESLYGFRHIWKRPSLFGMQMIFLTQNFFLSMGFILLAPYILARTGSDEVTLGIVQSAGAFGGLAGGLLMSAWGGPEKRVHGVLVSMILSGLFGSMTLGIGQTVLFWSISAFIYSSMIPIMNTSNQAIWQAKVPSDVQGRVFATRRLLAQITTPIAMLAAGPLTDRLFEPAMQAGGALANLFGGLVGVGPGAGMGLIFVFSGIIGAIFAGAGYFVPVVREIESILPDAVPAIAE
ncbi:MAG: MFS transporter, partial [Chloroflexota bacterium]